MNVHAGQSDQEEPLPSVAAHRPGGKLAVFAGSTPNVGATLVAFSTAMQLARTLECRIGYLCLNLKSSKLYRYVGMDKPLLGLDSIRAEMRSASLTPQRLGTCMEPLKEQPNLHLLYGTVQREQAEFYQPEDILHLLEAARSSYDICIVDVNAYWDNASTITSMMEADQRVLVTTPDLGHFQEDLNKGLKTLAPIFGISSDSFLLAVNQHLAAEPGGIRTGDIRKETGMTLAAVIAHDERLRDWLNRGRLVEYVSHNKQVVQAIAPLQELLTVRLGMKRRTDNPAAMLPQSYAQRVKSFFSAMRKYPGREAGNN
ncbi:MAG: hypothetical protein K0R57_5567 [Paenibacillaceae bacterium]|jgi:Flp pilus assembly CpaE family ATPase|nr:hypothetical protein [Paenibacillaceae bacterium]